MLLVPAAVLGVWLKLLSIRAFYPDAGLVETLAKVSSDVAFGLAWILLWILACHFTKGAVRTTLFYLAHLATIIFALLIVGNHEVMLRTGTPLTLSKMLYAATEGAQLGEMFSAQLTWSAGTLFVCAVVFPLVVPAAVGSIASRLIRRRPTRATKVAAALAMVVLLVASTWTAPTSSAAFSLSTPVQLALTPIREATAYPTSLGSNPAPNPDATHLSLRKGATKKNVVVITLESQRDSSTFPETTQPVTPVIDQLKAKAIRPERGYTVLPHTSKALTTLYCGITPPLDMDNTEADPGSLPGKCLPELLEEQGYSSAFFQSATETFERRRGTINNFGFQDFTPVEEMDHTGFRRANYFGYEDDIMLGPERAWLTANGDKPFVMGMLTVTAHHDYTLAGLDPIHFVDDPLLNQYLNVVHYQDQFVGNVLAMFKDLGLYDNTVFVITGDHGEGFGEHKIFAHDDIAYDEGIHIPFLFIDPSQEGKLVPGPANQLTVLPTLVDLAGFDLKSEDPYRPSLAGSTPQGTIFTTCRSRGKCTSTMTGDLKVIHHFGDRRDEVFNLVDDPFEQHDLAASTDSAWIKDQVDQALAWYVSTEQGYANYRAGEHK